MKQYEEWRKILNLKYSERDETIFSAGYTFALIETSEDIQPKYETPEDFKQRTGKDYPDDAPVWYKNDLSMNWQLGYFNNRSCGVDHGFTFIIANEHGKPPADYKPIYSIEDLAKNSKPLPDGINEIVNDNFHELLSDKPVCLDCWGSGWQTQFVTPCPSCHGTGTKGDK